MPVKPENVSDFPPSAEPNLLISAKPLVITSAFALSPYSAPAPIPTAIAITFFAIPDISQPIISSEV